MTGTIDTRAGLREALTLLGEGSDAVRSRIQEALDAGVEPAREPVTCETCKGTGRYAVLRDETEDCYKCRGTGEVTPFWPRIVRRWRWDSTDGPIIASRHPCGYVSVRPCDTEHDGRTYLGILVGEAPLGASATVDAEGALTVRAGMHNPAIYVFALGKVVYGAGSWWSSIRGPDDMRSISVEDVDTVWYVQALKAMQARAPLHPADELAVLRDSEAPDADRIAALEQLLAADRENRVGLTHHAVVSLARDGEVVEVLPLPCLVQTMRLLSTCELSVIDCETTGLHHLLGDRVVSVDVLDGCLSKDAKSFLTVREAFSETVNPGRPSSPQARFVHGFTDEELATKPRFAEVAQRLGAALEGRVLVAHNAPFDLGFLDMEFAHTPYEGPGSLATDIIDTRVISKMLWANDPGSLDALATRFGVDRGDRDARHTAAADTRLLAACLPGIVDAIKEWLAERML